MPAQVVFDAVPGAGEEIDQAFCFCDGERDQAEISGWRGVRAGRCKWEPAGGGTGAGGGDGDHGQGGDGECEVPQQR